MNHLWQQLERWQATQPDRPALEGFGHDGAPKRVTYGELPGAARALRMLWGAHHCVALLCDNTPDLTLLDLALMEAGVATVPIPPFFTPEQTQHLLRSAAVTCIVSDRPQQLYPLLAASGITVEESRQHTGYCATLHAFDIAPPTRATSHRFDKITFTSGSTGNPKGVCLHNTAMLTVAQSLRQATAADADDRHLALLPYATLLENIGGIYVPLLAGATVIQPGLARIGMEGSSGLDPQRMVEALHAFRATSCIMVPQMLLGLVSVAAKGLRPANLRFVAVGGAPVSPALLQQAEALALPVFEGYGLSEAASVVAVNSPSERKIGSVGKPLPHVTLRIADDGEIRVKGALMAGYLDHEGGATIACDDDGFWATGDLGHLDDDGYLYLSGRIRQMFVTAFGRNVAPAWVERELTIEPAIAQAAVFGEARPFNVAVVVARDPGGVEAAIARANRRLPDYARVRKFVLADAPFSPANGLASAAGAPLRDRIAGNYRAQIETLYREEDH